MMHNHMHRTRGIIVGRKNCYKVPETNLDDLTPPQSIRSRNNYGGNIYGHRVALLLEIWLFLFFLHVSGVGGFVELRSAVTAPAKRASAMYLAYFRPLSMQWGIEEDLAVRMALDSAA